MANRMRKAIEAGSAFYKEFLLLLIWFFIAFNIWTYISIGDVSLPLGKTRLVHFSGDAALVVLVLLGTSCAFLTWLALRKKAQFPVRK